MAQPRPRDEYEGYETQDKQFRREQYNERGIFANTNAAPRPFGVANAEKVVRMSDYRTPARKKVIYQDPTTSYADAGAGSQPIPTNISANPSTKKGGMKKGHLKLSLRRNIAAIALPLLTGIFALGWTFWLWITVQLPFAVLSLIALGLWQWSNETWWLNAFNGIVGKIMGWFGYHIELFAGFFYITWLLTILFGLTAFFGVLLQYLLSMQHPVSGRAASLKLALLCAAVTGYIIPGLNLFPWIWPYIFLMMRYPK